jgi:glycosyltransferase involved in cell wall biosynthesis
MVLFGILFQNKWFGYVDKYVIFPIYLLGLLLVWQIRGIRPQIHIVDQGSAIYVPLFRGLRTIVTCHDILATRGAMGDASVACAPSFTGRLLQRAIAHGLSKATVLVAVSNATASDIQTLFKRSSTLIHLGLPDNLVTTGAKDLRMMSWSNFHPVLTERYLLMVGGNLPRKNRAFAFSILEALPDYQLVIAGEGHPPHEVPATVKDRVVSIPSPSSELLTTLYEQAHCLLFPSIAEGFGIPIIEAQKCSCPVLGSDRTSVPEILGDGGLSLPIIFPQTWVDRVRQLEDPGFRAYIVHLGHNNLARFTVPRMQAEYKKVYNS